MNNKAFSLQLLSHKQIFETRDEAKTYFEDNFKPFSLVGEPAVAFYGDSKSPKAMIAIGVADKKVFYIDTNELSESIDDIASKTEEEEGEITNSLDLIKNIITACGLTLDENKKTNRVTYDTDVKDDVIGNAKSLAEAINLLSKFIQKGFKDNELKVDDTESIKLSYKPDATDGKKLTAEVKLSNSGDSDDTDFNDNIICKKSDGLYAAANLEYDEEKHTLTFTSSGYKDGKYKDDAHKKVINLDEHTIVSAENHHHNIELVINKIVGTNKYVISGDVRLSGDENNILKIEDEHLIVDGRAKNIKYGDITVAKGLNNLKDRCDDLADKIDNIKDRLSIDGTTTDTFEANVVKGTHGFTVSGDVRLSNDTSVKVSDGGLSVNVDIDVDTASNQLTLKVGNRTKMVSLPGIQIVKNIRYDEKTASIIIEFTDSNAPLTIPVSDMIETIYVQNDASSAVELHKHEKEGEPGRSYLSAMLKLKTSDNILAKDPVTGELYVPETAVSNAVAVETNRALEAERRITEKVNTVSSSITDEVTRAKAKETELSQGIASNLSAINDEINRSTNKDTELENKISSHIEAYTEYKTDNDVKVSVLQDAVKTIETDVAKKYNDLDAKDNQTISDYKAADVTLQSNIDKEAVRATTEEGKINSALTDEVARAKAKETELSNKVNSLDSDYKAADTQLQSKIDDLTTGLTNEVNRATEAENKIKSDLTVEINKKVASVTIEKNSTSDLQYTLYVDGKPSGEVNIPKDQLLTNVEYLAGEKIIRFTFETTSGVSVTDVNVADLVDTYIAGDGLTLVDNKFSVKKSDGSQSYLEVTADGVKVVGVDEALALKANAADVYTKDEIEAKGYLTEHQDVSSFVTKDELAEVEIKVNANTSAVTDEVTRAKAKEIELLDTIKDNEWGVQEGQHLGGIILNKEVNKGGTDILSATVVLSEMASNALINDKGSLYVSNQAKDYNLADGKTVQLAIEELQKKVVDGGDNTELNDRLTECESQVTELVSNDNKQDAKLTSLETDVENLKKKPSLKAANTNSVAMTVNEDTITSEIKLASVDNLIRVNEDGLSFDGSIDYGTY